jgi:peroxiredoxin
VLLYFGGRSSQPKGGPVAARPAPPVTRASTGGGNVSLSGYAGGNVLIYFSEGVGCDACFYQMVDLEQNSQQLADAGITVLPIVMNPLDQTQAEVQRFGLTTPFLVDSDGSVSKAYDMLGKGMHANLPGHGFVLIDGSGNIRWQKEYPSMYVSTGDIMNAISPYLS